MKINVITQPCYKVIAVGVPFENITGESYREESFRRIAYATKVKMGIIKQFVPNWYREAMDAKRNQAVPSEPNEFIKEMN